MGVSLNRTNTAIVNSVATMPREATEAGTIVPLHVVYGQLIAAGLVLVGHKPFRTFHAIGFVEDILVHETGGAVPATRVGLVVLTVLTLTTGHTTGRGGPHVRLGHLCEPTVGRVLVVTHLGIPFEMR
jgi:H+/Cl- antiporter ClcA